MIYNEIYGDLFDYENEYYLAHCISADCALGAGIAVEFNRRYGMRNKLKSKYPQMKYPTCVLIDRVFNLVTKEYCYYKPTYTTLEAALYSMKTLIKWNNIKKVAMPLIGCGLDKLKWDKVSGIIKRIFSDVDIEILIVKKG